MGHWSYTLPRRYGVFNRYAASTPTASMTGDVEPLPCVLGARAEDHLRRDVYGTVEHELLLAE